MEANQSPLYQRENDSAKWQGKQPRDQPTPYKKNPHKSNKHHAYGFFLGLRFDQS